MLILEILQPLTFATRMRGYHSDQSDITLVALKAGTEVGYIDYSLWHGNVAVQMIKALKRGLGVGPALVRQLQSEFPDTEIDFGMLTSDGAKMLAALPTTYIPNPEYAEKSARLAQLQAQDIAWMKIMDNGGPEAASFIQQIGDDRWNELHDEVWHLEQELRTLTPGKRLIQTGHPMKAREIFEAPIADLEVHHMDQPGTFPDVDRKLMQNPAHLKKIVHQFANTGFVFNLYFINQPGVAYTKPNSFQGEEGEDNRKATFTSQFYADAEAVGEITPDDIFARFGVRVKPNPNAIGILFLSNANETHSIPLTPWIVAHRIGHAILDMPSGNPISDRSSELPDLHRSLPGIPGLSLGRCLTMRSARTKTLQLNEAYVEMIAQYLTTDWVTLAVPPDYTGAMTSITGRTVEAVLQAVSHKIVKTIEAILDDCVGHILLAV